MCMWTHHTLSRNLWFVYLCRWICVDLVYNCRSCTTSALFMDSRKFQCSIRNSTGKRNFTNKFWTGKERENVVWPCLDSWHCLLLIISSPQALLALRRDCVQTTWQLFFQDFLLWKIHICLGNVVLSYMWQHCITIYHRYMRKLFYVSCSVSQICQTDPIFLCCIMGVACVVCASSTFTQRHAQTYIYIHTIWTYVSNLYRHV